MINLNYNEVFDKIVNHFSVDNLPGKGANWILPDGRFLDVPTHGTVDEYVFKEYGITPEEIDEYIDMFKTSIMSEYYNCIRINDGATMSGDFYVQLPPKPITNAQALSLEDWIDGIDHSRILDVSTSDDQYSNYDLRETDGNYIVKRIKRFYSGGTLYEGRNHTINSLTNKLKETLSKKSSNVAEAWEDDVDTTLDSDNVHYDHRASLSFGGLENEPGYKISPEESAKIHANNVRIMKARNDGTRLPQKEYFPKKKSKKD